MNDIDEFLEQKIDAVAVIYYAANCPSCGGFDFSHLVWFDTMKDLCNFLITHTAEAYKVERLYHTETRKPIQNIKLEYELGRHCINYVDIVTSDMSLRIKRHPYEQNRFVIESD